MRAGIREMRRYNLSDFELWETDLEPPTAVGFGADADADAALAKVEANGVTTATVQLITDGHPAGADRSRNDFRVCCHLARAGLTNDEIRSIFQHFPIGERYHQRGSGDPYLARTIGRARAEVKNQEELVAREHLAEVAAASTNGTGPARAAPAVRSEFPESAWHAVFADYREAMATTEAPDAHHFGAAVTVFGATLGRRVFAVYGRELYPNLFSVLVGKTGATRKTETQRRGIDGVALAVDPELPYITAIGSAEGLLESLARAEMTPLEYQLYEAHVEGRTVGEDGEPDKAGQVPDMPPPPAHGRRTLLAPEEFASMLAKARQEGAGNLTPIITQAYDCPAVLNPPTRSRRIIAVDPTLSILTASAPVWIERFLGMSELVSGFCNRFCYWLGEPKEPVPWPEPPRQEPLNRVRRALHDSLERWAGARHEFALADDAERVWASWYAVHHSRLATYNEVHAAVVQRAPTFAIKLGLIFAAMRNDAAVIEAEDLERATLIADYLEWGGGELLGALGQSGDTVLERLVLKRLAAGDHLPKRQLHQSVGGRFNAERLHRTLDALLKVGVLQTDPTGAFFDPEVVKPQEAQR